MDKDDSFKNLIDSVKPLKDDGKVEFKKKPKRPHQIQHPATEPEAEFLEAADKILFFHAQLSKQTMRRLKRGQYHVEDELDLHGMRSDQAEHYFHEFMQECLKHHYRCVRIIHGKGHRSPDGPILKNKLNNWLRNHHNVQAFCSATDKDGGTGALYVLITT